MILCIRKYINQNQQQLPAQKTKQLEQQPYLKLFMGTDQIKSLVYSYKKSPIKHPDSQEILPEIWTTKGRSDLNAPF